MPLGDLHHYLCSCEQAGGDNPAITPSEPAIVFAPQPVVAIQDQFGNTVTNSTLTVIASLQTGTGALGGTAGVAAVGGLVNFAGFSISTEGSDKVLRFTQGTLANPTVDTNAFSFELPPPPVVTTCKAGFQIENGKCVIIPVVFDYFSSVNQLDDIFESCATGGCNDGQKQQILTLLAGITNPKDKAALLGAYKTGELTSLLSLMDPQTVADTLSAMSETQAVISIKTLGVPSAKATDLVSKMTTKKAGALMSSLTKAERDALAKDVPVATLIKVLAEITPEQLREMDPKALMTKLQGRASCPVKKLRYR